MGLEEAGNCLYFQTSEPLEWTPGTQAGKGPQACSLCVHVRTDARRGIHRVLPHYTSANRGAIQESPWRFQQETGPHTGGPGSRPQVPALPTFGPAASRGQHDAAQRYPSPGRRALRPVLPGKRRPGAAGRRGRLAEPSHPPAVTPSSPGPTTPGLSGSLPDLGGLLARPRSGSRSGARVHEAWGLGGRRGSRPGGGDHCRSGGRSFIEVPTYSAGPRDSPRYRRRRLRLGARWPPESVPRWATLSASQSRGPAWPSVPRHPLPSRSWRACSLASSRRRRVAASARAPQPAQSRLRSSHRQLGLGPTLRFPGLSFPFREMG